MSDLTQHQTQYLREAKLLMQEVKDGSDLSCALIAWNMIEKALQELIRLVLIPESPSTNKIIPTEDGKGLGLSAHYLLALAHALGYLSDFEFKQCEAIKEIRNLFAHSLTPLKFSDEKLEGKIQKLSNKIPSAFRGNPDDSEERKQFCSVAVFISAILRYIRPLQLEIKRPNPLKYSDSESDGTPKIYTGKELNEQFAPK